jgi:DNA-binding response OmpR family regulator
MHNSPQRLQTILLVEDAFDFRTQTAKKLRKAGYRLLTASNLAQARQKFKDESPDLLLLDIQLNSQPDAGFQFCNEIRQAILVPPGLADTPIVFLTSSTSEEDRRRATELGADAYVVKSASYAEIIETVDQILRRRPTANVGISVAQLGAKPAILIIEDQPEHQEIILNHLQSLPCTTLTADGVEEAQRLLVRHAPALIILDLRLGNDSGAGLRFLHELRLGGQLGQLQAFKDLPVLLLTERENLNPGEQAPQFTSYFSKRMFLTSPEVFVANVRMHLSYAQPASDVVVFGDLRIHLRHAQVWICGRSIDLPPQQYHLLLALAQAQGEPVSNLTLCEQMDQHLRHADEAPLLERNLRPLISRLRAQLKAACPGRFEKVDPIQRFRGRLLYDDGYRLVLPPLEIL